MSCNNKFKTYKIYRFFVHNLSINLRNIQCSFSTFSQKATAPDLRFVYRSYIFWSCVSSCTTFHIMCPPCASTYAGIYIHQQEVSTWPPILRFVVALWKFCDYRSQFVELELGLFSGNIFAIQTFHSSILLDCFFRLFFPTRVCITTILKSLSRVYHLV